MYKLYNKKTIEGLSPLVVEKAEKDYIQMITKGYSKQNVIPTLDTPIKIRNIGDNIQLFDLKSYYNTAGVANCSRELLDNGIRLKFVAGADAWIGTVIDKNKILPEALRPGSQKVKPNTTYTLKMSSAPKCYMSFLDKSYTATETYKQIPKSVYTFTTNSSTYYIYLRLGYQSNSSGLTSYDFTDIKLEESSTAGSYTEYGCGSIDYEINTTQNIFDKDMDIELDGQYRAWTTGNIATNQNYYGVKVKVEENKEYKVFSYQDYSNLCYFDKNMTYITGEIFGKSAKRNTFKTPSNCEYITLAVAKSGINEFSITETKTIHFPLSKGQLLHEGDYLAKDGIHPKRKTIILTGEETITLRVASQGNSCIFSVDGIWNNKDLSTRGNIICTHFKNEPIKWANIDECIFGGGQNEGNTMYFKILKSRLSEITSAGCKAFVKQQYENNTPIIVEYQLAEEVITPLTTEQQNVIDNIELFEGYNQINSLDEFDFEMKIIYTPQFTEDIRKSFRTGITKAYLEVIGTDIIIDYQNYLKNIEFYELRFVPDKGIFGQAVAKKIVVNFNNLDNTLNLQDKEIRLFIETEVDEENYRIKYGDFIVQHSENENVNDNTSLTGLDYMIKTNNKYTDTITYPCTLRQLANNICTQCGLTLSKESFKNENFVVENNQFVSGETCRQIIQGIALSAFSWARIDENNELHFDFDKNFSIKEELTNDEYYNLDFNNEIYGPVNRVIMRDSQIDGENVTVSDNDSIETNGVNEIVIEDNPFAYTQEKREQLIEAGKDLFGFSYLPINSSKLIGYIYLNCLDKVKFKNMQGQSFETYFFNHIINYEGTTLDTIEVPAMTKTETKYTFIPDVTQTLKNTQIIVDKANQNILGIIEKQEGQSNQITSIEASLDGINTKIQDNQDEINERFNKIETTLEGTTQILSNKGGNNIFYYAKEFWTDGTENGTAKLNEYTDTEVQKISVSGNGYKINKGTSEQKVNVKNDIYTISFTYKKLIDLAIGYVLINNERIDLSSSAWKEEVITLNIDTNNVDFKIISDTDNAFEIYDLMGTIGEEKQIWTQNPNETRTDTVTIGKGIEVKSSSKNTYARFDADGNRIFNNSTSEVVTALTDKGVETNEIDSKIGKIGGILIQEMDSQTWISSLL